MRVCFFFNAQRHQLLHGISVAVALARRAGYEVHVASPAAGHIAYARGLTARLGGAPIVFTTLDSPLLRMARRGTGGSIPPKILTLAAIARWLDGFDAVALPERTSLLLKRLGTRRPAFIHLDHGAGDRAVGFDRRIRHFDLVLMAGEKHRRRLLRDGLIRDGAHAIVGYPKFDAAAAAREPGWTPFPDDDRPVVLYNPHFCGLGSWEKMGGAVLDAFARQDRYNLIVAPHVRLLDNRAGRARWAARLAAHAGNPRIFIDAGSDRAIDMSYTTLADAYIGDVSSQVYEFLATPRPCLFLDAHDVAWERDENYAHWRFGPVLRSTDGLIDAVDAAFAGHIAYEAVQRAGFAETFGANVAPSRVAAEAIGEWLDRRIAPVRQLSGGFPWARAAAMAAVLLGGWMLHDAIGPLTGTARAQDGFVQEAAEAWQATRARERTRPQPASIQYDRASIAGATRIAMPDLPAGWRLSNVQVYPSDVGPSVQLSLHSPEGEALSLVAMRMDAETGPTPRITREQDAQIAYWARDDAGFALFGELPSDRMLALAADLAD